RSPDHRYSLTGLIERPQKSADRGQSDRLTRDGDNGGDLVRGRVDPRDAAAKVVGHPYRVARGERGDRPLAYADRDHQPSRDRVDPADRAVVDVGHPQGTNRIGQGYLDHGTEHCGSTSKLQDALGALTALTCRTPPADNPTPGSIHA